MLLGSARIFGLVLAGIPLFAAVGDQVPKLTAKTLDGHEISLPGSSKVSAYVLAFGFSHKSDKAFAAWDKRLAPVYSTNPRVAYYELPVLQGVPGFVKGFILHGMRRQIPKPEQSRFAPVYKDEAALKSIVGYREPEAAYLVVANSDGKVVWSSHGQPSDADFAALRSCCIRPPQVTVYLRERGRHAFVRAVCSADFHRSQSASFVLANRIRLGGFSA